MDNQETDKTIRWFQNMTPEKRATEKIHYENLVEREKGTLRVISPRSNSWVDVSPKMPWMLPHYELGLEKLLKVMRSLGELPEEVVASESKSQSNG